ncbi:DUF4430 domain-containing protein [Clostridium lundense]|uniref:DUF4430 domain-containing protein n=1 Tax=Clostridium lundense TaxID=319475 RepID=UPI00048752AF|nr:DUF4430 domain-containing protein [Clostridium lundense]
MNIKRKRIISFFMAFAMILSTLFNFNLFNPNMVYAQEESNVQAAVTVNDAIKAVVDCMNKDYYSGKSGTLDGEAYASMYKAGANIKEKGWKVNKDTSTTGLKYLGSKVNQALALMDLNEDPTTYKDVNLISDITEEISKVTSPKGMGINEVKALILLDRYNEKFSDKKVNYNVENAIKNLIGAQKEDGSINNVPQNTAASIVALNKHKDIEGVNDCITKALDYLHKSQRDDGGILNSKSFNTKINAESVAYLVLAGEDLTSDKWTKNDKTSIDALFTLWNGKGFVSSYGSKDYYSIPKVLDALVSLKEAGYGDYQIKGSKFDNIIKEEPEKTCKANITIVYPKSDKKYDIKFKPSEIAISSKKQSGLTVLGALQAATDQYEAKGTMVTSIFEIKNEGMNGWMYSLNGKVPDTFVNETEIKDGDKIVWYYSKNGMDGKVPSYEEIVNIVNGSSEQEKPEKPEETKKDGSEITTIINGVIDYYNTEHFITNQSQLVNYEYSAMYKAEADLKKKPWYFVEKYETKYDKNWSYLGSKVHQSLILIDLDKDANDHLDRHLINEISETVDQNNSYFRQTDLQAVIALDKYNEKFKDKKVNYDVEKAVKNILAAQCEDGGFKERGNSSIPINTGYALTALSKHKDIKGVNEAIGKALTYLQGIQKDDGGFYDKTFVTGYHSEILRGIISVGENPTSKKWTKPSGKNPVDALFTLWKDNNSFDGMKGESVNNKGWVEATWKALYTLVELRDAGYGKYIVDGVKVKGIDDGVNEPEEKTCKVKVCIAMPENGKYVPFGKSEEVTISDKKHNKGFTALGALQAKTTLFEMIGDMVTSIYGHQNAGLNGWMYSVNGVVPNEMAGKVSVKAGDKVIWYYSMSSMEGKTPTWEELTGEDTNTENTKIDKAINDVKEYYKGFNGSFGKVYDYITAMALRSSGVDASKIASKANIYGNSNLHNTARNLMSIIAMGENPRNYKDKDYVNLILNDKNKFYEDSSCEYVAKAIIALDMAQAEYDSEKAIKALISKAHDEGDGKYSFGSQEYDEWADTYEYSVNVDYTIAVLTAIANHKDVEGVTEKINGIKKYLKELQTNNGFIKQKTSWSEEESCHITANLIQALIVLGENPLSDEWTKKDEKGNKITMLDAVLSCKEGNRFKGNSKSGMASDIDTSAAFAALVDLSKNKSMYNELRYKKVVRPSIIKIKGESQISLIQGEERLLIAEAFDSNGIKVENAEFVWESSDKNICSVENGKLKAIKDGKTDIIVKLLNDTKVFTTINVTVTKNEDYHSKIGKALDKLKVYYDKHNSYDYMSALALRHISDDLNLDLKKIDSNLRLYTKDCAIHYAKNIMEIIAAGKNPECYNNKNYIKLLVDSQNENGEFIVNNSADKDKIVTLALSIIALDMANADYNVEKAINRLVSMIKDGNHGIDGLYTEVETKAIAITALSKHKNIASVKETIKLSLDYIKDNQNADAGFDHAGYVNNPFAIGTVIQALIANDIDPLSWIKNGKTMVDVLIERQMDNGGFEYSEHLPNTPENEIFDDFKCTETAFAALADMYNNKSMYNEIKLNIVEKIEIKNLTDVKEFRVGNDAKITVQAINNTKEAKNTALIVGLFNKDGKLANYVAAKQSIESGKTVELNGIIKLPKEGEYTIKAFVWNGLEDMIPLSNVIEIPVK